MLEKFVGLHWLLRVAIVIGGGYAILLIASGMHHLIIVHIGLGAYSVGAIAVFAGAAYMLRADLRLEREQAERQAAAIRAAEAAQLAEEARQAAAIADRTAHEKALEYLGELRRNSFLIKKDGDNRHVLMGLHDTIDRLLRDTDLEQKHFRTPVIKKESAMIVDHLRENGMANDMAMKRLAHYLGEDK